MSESWGIFVNQMFCNKFSNLFITIFQYIKKRIPTVYLRQVNIGREYFMPRDKSEAFRYEVFARDGVECVN